jgi:cobalt/nickel transport system permease protein
MHITEGIITGKSAMIYTGVGVALIGLGAYRMKEFVTKFPEKKPLLGMGGALIFFISLIPIPAFTGTCSHPCGTPLVAILLGPFIGVALAGISLLLQAALFAHGGFSTWGANILALGLFGSLFGWGAFRVARKLGFPLWAAGFAGGLIGDLMVYAASGMILATTLANGPNPQYSLTAYLAAIYAAYLPTQLPISIGEMLVTGLALQYVFRQRPEVLEELGIVHTKKGSQQNDPRTIILLMVLVISFIFTVDVGLAEQNKQNSIPLTLSSIVAKSNEKGGMSGMDETVNERLAEAAGLSPRDPYINIEAMGDLWNMLLLLGGGVCGFIIGRWWHLLYGKDRKEICSKNQRISK